jgi:hypothetical protein
MVAVNPPVMRLLPMPYWALFETKDIAKYRRDYASRRPRSFRQFCSLLKQTHDYNRTYQQITAICPAKMASKYDNILESIAQGSPWSEGNESVRDRVDSQVGYRTHLVEGAFRTVYIYNV